MTFPSPGRFGPVALKDSAGKPVTGVTASVPVGYTATVDGYHLSVTGPVADDVTVTTTTPGGTARTFGVRVEPAAVDLLGLVGRVVEVEALAQAAATRTVGVYADGPNAGRPYYNPAGVGAGEGAYIVEADSRPVVRTVEV